jgi:hypothetical protein
MAISMEHLLPKNIFFEAQFECILTDALTGKIRLRRTFKNLTCNAATYVYARIAAGNTTYSGAINYVAVGTSSLTPMVTDTQLNAEVARVTYSSRSFSLNQALFSFFFNTASANFNLQEIGLVIDGTAVANTGQMFDHANIDVNKTSSDNLTVNATVTFSAPL